MFSLTHRTKTRNKHSQPFYRELIEYFGEDTVRKGTFMDIISNVRDWWINPEKTIRITYDFYKTPYYFVTLLDGEGHSISGHNAPTLKEAMELANKTMISRAYHSQTEEN